MRGVRYTWNHTGKRDIGFTKETAAFVGNVILEDGVLEISLWAIEGAGSMTSRRASISRLKHTTLRVSMTGAERADARALLQTLTLQLEQS